MKLYELTIEDINTDEVFAISMVEEGAIQSDWVAFDKEEVAFAKVDMEQKMVIGAILIPNKRILRIDGEGQPYEVFFTPETIKKLSHNYLMKKYQDKVTLEHDKPIKGVTLVESWLKEGKLDKSNNFGLNLPEGSWIGIMKITDDKLWNDYVKTGKTNGFSIEGIFEHKLVKASKEELYSEYMLSEIKKIILEAYPNLSNPTYSGEEEKDFISPALLAEDSYTDYPESVSNNAKRALDWAEENGWGDCGEATGKQRANQLANKEPISRDTIARMASFKRHQQNKDVPYTEGCGGLMWDAWGGTSGVEWAINKLKEIDGK